MKNKAKIESMILNKQSLPRTGDSAYRAYERSLKDVLRDNLQTPHEVLYSAEEGVFEVECSAYIHVDDEMPTLITKQTYKINPQEPLADQICKIQKSVDRLHARLAVAARAIILESKRCATE